MRFISEACRQMSDGCCLEHTDSWAQDLFRCASIFCFWVVSRSVSEWVIDNCETQPPAYIAWVALSSNVRPSCIVRPASVTPPLISPSWCFWPYKTYIFCEDMILVTCQCQHLSSVAELSPVYCCLVLILDLRSKKFETNFIPDTIS